MRNVPTRTIAFCILTIFASAPARTAEEPSELPLRKAGLWQLKTTMDEGRGPKDQTITMCVDDQMEHNTAKSAKAEHDANCKKYEIKRSAELTSVDASCVFSERNVESRTEMRGDFKSSFQVKIDSTTSGKEGPQSVSVKRTIAQEGKYMGESCGELKPGEATDPNGNKVLVQ